MSQTIPRRVTSYPIRHPRSPAQLRGLSNSLSSALYSEQTREKCVSQMVYVMIDQVWKKRLCYL